MEEQFQQRIERNKHAIKEAKKTYGQIANLRLLVLGIAFVFTYMWVVPYRNGVMLVAVFISYGGFIYLVRKHEIGRASCRERVYDLV